MELLSIAGIPLGIDKSDSKWGKAKCSAATLILDPVVTLSQTLLLFH